MKKVRYLAGAVGVVPALGLMPAGNALAAATHTPASKGKTVSLAHIKGAHPDNVGDCPAPGKSIGGVDSKGFSISGHGTANRSCISYLIGTLTGGHTELDMRTRFYSKGHTKVASHFNAPHRTTSRTFWSHTGTTIAYSVCAALVLASKHSVVTYPAVCTNTGA